MQITFSALLISATASLLIYSDKAFGLQKLAVNRNNGDGLTSLMSHAHLVRDCHVNSVLFSGLAGMWCLCVIPSLCFLTTPRSYRNWLSCTPQTINTFKSNKSHEIRNRWRPLQCIRITGYDIISSVLGNARVKASLTVINERRLKIMIFLTKDKWIFKAVAIKKYDQRIWDRDLLNTCFHHSHMHCWSRVWYTRHSK